MKFYDLGDNDYDMASPYRLHVPERGIDVTYGKEGDGAVIFTTTDRGRCIFGLDGELQHKQLQGRLESGERMVMRGVLWPKIKAAVTWEMYSSMNEFRRGMELFARGLKDELGMDPDDVLLYLGYMHVSEREMGKYDTYNVEIPVGDAYKVKGQGDVNDCFYALFLRSLAGRNDNGNVSGNGMKDRDIWRHYEVVGEGKAENLFNEIVREILDEERK